MMGRIRTWLTDDIRTAASKRRETYIEGVGDAVLLPISIFGAAVFLATALVTTFGGTAGDVLAAGVGGIVGVEAIHFAAGGWQFLADEGYIPTRFPWGDPA